MRGPGVSVLVFALTAFRAPALADPPPAVLTIEDAVLAAAARQPSVRTAEAAEAAATSRVEVARADLLPDLRVGAQLNRATGNVVPGATFPLPGLPSVSGPPTGRAFDLGTWGTTVGVSAAWNVADLSRRMTLVDVSLTERRQAADASDARRLQAGFDAADAFLGVLAARESVRAARANVERAEAVVTVARTLVAQNLRPALDLARAESERAAATIQLVRAEQAVEVRLARLAETLGTPGARPEIAPGSLLDAPPVRPTAVAGTSRHPLLREADIAVRVAQLRQHAVSLEYLPRVDLVAALWFRGGGAFGGGPDLGAAQGLVPDTPNWAVGVVVSWPVLELFAVRARSRVAEAQVAVQRARREEVEQTIAAQIDTARTLLDGARRVAENTAPALDAARAAETQATARYRAGLGTIVEVADAQRMLASAEVDEASAHIEVRRATLLLARALGDLTPFLAEAGGH